MKKRKWERKRRRGKKNVCCGEDELERERERKRERKNDKIIVEAATMNLYESSL
jgi:hypothetical protein